MPPATVHFLRCETRNSTQQNFHVQTMPRLSAFGGVVASNVCLGLKWHRHAGTGLLSQLSANMYVKVPAIQRYAASIPPDDLIFVLDSDSIFNVRSVTSAKVLSRFEAARDGRQVVFQAEPYCFAPSKKAMMIGYKDLGGCTKELVRLYDSLERKAMVEKGSDVIGKPWDCAKHLNSGAFAGRAQAIMDLMKKMRQPWGWRELCPPTKATRHSGGFDDQCVLTAIMLQQNVSIQLDYNERLFATAIATTRGSRSKTKRNGSNSVACAYCRQRTTKVPCRCSREWTWVRESSTGEPWQRPMAHQKRCGLPAGSPPLIMHFQNAVGKAMLRRLYH